MTGGALPFERLQVIVDDVPRNGALNMALDEVLLQSPVVLPLLRFYQWERPAVTFGYFEPAEAARRVARGREIVRRLTGGGIVEHGDDLTFTLIVPRTDAFARLRSAESYRQVHDALARALEQGGLLSQTHPDLPTDRASDGRPNACFERPVLHDLMAGSRKVAGGAQRRTRAGLLHQGSVQPGALPGHPWREIVGREFPRALAHACEARAFTSDEIARARLLVAARYASADWTDRV